LLSGWLLQRAFRIANKFIHLFLWDADDNSGPTDTAPDGDAAAIRPDLSMASGNTGEEAYPQCGDEGQMPLHGRAPHRPRSRATIARALGSCCSKMARPDALPPSRIDAKAVLIWPSGLSAMLASRRRSAITVSATPCPPRLAAQSSGTRSRVRSLSASPKATTASSRFAIPRSRSPRVKSTTPILFWMVAH